MGCSARDQQGPAPTVLQSGHRFVGLQHSLHSCVADSGFGRWHRPRRPPCQPPPPHGALGWALDARAPRGVRVGWVWCARCAPSSLQERTSREEGAEEGRSQRMETGRRTSPGAGPRRPRGPTSGISGGKERADDTDRIREATQRPGGSQRKTCPGTRNIADGGSQAAGRAPEPASRCPWLSGAATRVLRGPRASVGSSVGQPAAHTRSLEPPRVHTCAHERSRPSESVHGQVAGPQSGAQARDSSSHPGWSGVPTRAAGGRTSNTCQGEKPGTGGAACYMVPFTQTSERADPETGSGGGEWRVTREAGGFLLQTMNVLESVMMLAQLCTSPRGTELHVEKGLVFWVFGVFFFGG